MDYGLLAQRAAERRIAGAMEAFLQEQESDPEDVVWPDDLAGPFDGCDTCHVREVLHAA